MLVLRCTQKLLKKHPGPVDDRQDALVPTLGSWHANLIRLAHSPIVLCVNDISLIAMLIPGRNFPDFVSAFQHRLVKPLRRMGLTEDAISTERAAIEIVRIQPSNSRSVLASMNDLMRNLKSKVGNHFHFNEADALEDTLSEIPIGALEYHFPKDVAMAAFGLAQNRYYLPKEINR